MKRIWYKIPVDQSVSEIKRVVETLFKYGYVYHPSERMKDYLTLCRRYTPAHQSEWEYIRIGHGPECNHVMFHLCFWEYRSTKADYVTITLEDFLKVNGYEIPKEEKKLVMTLEEFDQDFEKFRRITVDPDDDFEVLLDQCA